MAHESEYVYVVDDDSTVREALSSLLRANGKNVKLFASGAEYLHYVRHDSAACLLLDLNMPEMNGLELQRLISTSAAIPIVFITGVGDIPSTVKAMKGGAVDFLTKPIDESALLATIEGALQRDKTQRRQAQEHADLTARYQSLTPREKEVLPLLAAGQLNKQVASDLGITEYTVQIHRGNIMRKMNADSFAELVRFAEKICPELAPEVAKNG